MEKMDRSQAMAFLMAKARTGKLATVRPDGRPHVAPIWFIVDGESIVFTTWHTSVKAGNLAHDSRASLCVDDEQSPFAYVIVEGQVTTSPEDLAELQHWATQIAGRYMGPELAEAYGRRNGVVGELLCRLSPGRVIGYSGVAD